MKRIITCFLLVCMALVYTNCTDKFLEYNTDPYQATKDQMKYKNYQTQSAILSMQNAVIPTENNLNQFCECLLGGSYGGYLADSNSGFVGRNFATYSADQGWSSVPFVVQIERFYPSYNQLQDFTEDPVLLGVGNILKVAVFHRITDIYGHIPYSKIGKDGKLVAPYDMQSDVYNKMFEELDLAITNLTENSTLNFNPNADKVFKGNVVKWVKFANSLKLRLAMRLSYVDAALAQKKAEEAVKHEIGVMSSNGDNAFYPVEKSPFRVIMYDYNGGDSRVSADITTYMNGYEDPRREKYFVKSTFTETNELKNGFYGLRSGINFNSSDNAHKYCNMNVKETNEKILWMNSAESAFLKAEGALRGWDMGGQAVDFYNEGIKLSFEQWGVSGADEYLANIKEINAYEDPLKANSYYGKQVSKSIVSWNTENDFEKNLEQIITQKWIANFPLGIEAWSEFRRTNYPKLMEVPHNLSNGVIATDEFAHRLPYPEKEYLENKKNLQVALDALNGPDNLATKVWWDCKPKN